MNKIHDDEIHIFRIRTKEYHKKIFDLETTLSEDELQRAYRFKFENLKNNFIIGRGILRNILGQYLNMISSEINISYAEKGKPFLKGKQLKFNLSHSKDFVIYAFCLNDEVGIDIEYKKEMTDALQIAESFFSQSEREELKKIEQSKIGEAFFNCWTRKEAFIKAIGDGLSYPLENFSVSLKPGDEPELLWIKDKNDEVKEWSLYSVDVDKDYISSLALKSNNKEIIDKEYSFEL